ncbi:hypothetical protein HGP14_17040 [Rhizobium sp. P32RR-XVIII]|nr:hypothetical protein [Rhizobium sp. P32RR-XVIII]NLS05053.1 hypothetical protein [Rhizobium sp. P32RR-XVIII]
MPKSPILHAIRHKVEGKVTMPNIPPKASRYDRSATNVPAAVGLAACHTY